MTTRSRRSILFIASLLAALTASPAHAWVAAGGGGRGYAAGPRGAAVWNNGAGYARGAYGGAAAWNRGGGAIYRPPVYSGGCYNCGSSNAVAAGVAGLAVGAMVGAAAAHNSPPPPATVVVQQPTDYQAAMSVGTRVTLLPGNCGSATVGNVEYYQCGPNWFRPYFGNASVYYQVVQPPY